ncbi:AMP deaminase [Nematocida sp. AWRm77]|nr:AMP deaminase [Nematocida sp. AWRm77]
MKKEVRTDESDLTHALQGLIRALELRKKYMRASLQNKSWSKHIPSAPVTARQTENGYVMENASVQIPTVGEFYDDIEFIGKLLHNGPLKSFCFQRLEHLELQFQMHRNECSAQEKKEQKTVSSKDIYTVVKVDTHIHHSACMNSKKLLQFIKKKLREAPDDVVHKDTKEYTLKEVFRQINKSSENLCIDSLDTHSNLDTFHRFDRFNSKYNPYGIPLLREVFLKYDNYIDGKYLAEITKEIIEETEDKEYLRCEWGISVYGKKASEFERLSNWIEKYNIKSSCIKWYIQVPRLYGLFKGYEHVNNFAEFLQNIFAPMIESSLGTEKDAVSEFMEDVIGIDSVDDESIKDKRSESEKEEPSRWDHKDNPSYHYYMYHMYYNVAVINQIRASRGKNLLAFRPHSGEHGETDHLISSFLTSKSIAHGVKLRKCPVLQYLYYLSQVGISMSPLSNNSLFIIYKKNPFPQFFYRGLNVCLSTDDPLQFHFTREPLMEEYSVASQIWRLSSCDQCEIARNSVLISNFPKKEKESWIGVYENNGRLVNVTSDTNIPPTRFNYRAKQIQEEYSILKKHIYQHSIANANN